MNSASVNTKCSHAIHVFALVLRCHTLIDTSLFIDITARTRLVNNDAVVTVTVTSLHQLDASTHTRQFILKCLPTFNSGGKIFRLVGSFSFRSQRRNWCKNVSCNSKCCRNQFVADHKSTRRLDGHKLCIFSIHYFSHSIILASGICYRSLSCFWKEEDKLLEDSRILLCFVLFCFYCACIFCGRRVIYFFFNKHVLSRFLLFFICPKEKINRRYIHTEQDFSALGKGLWDAFF